MKIRIKSGDCPSYLTVGKVYKANKTKRESVFAIINDDGSTSLMRMHNCIHLNGGSWEIVNEEA